MTWAARLRLTAGILVVIAIVCACTIVFNQRISQATSRSASIEATEYPIGTTVGGIVTHQYVTTGGTVKKGDRLVDVTPTVTGGSSTAENKEITTPYSRTQNGVTTLLATVDGTVSSVAIPPGAFASAGTTILTIDQKHSLRAVAQLTLTARDYARLRKGASARVTLPNQRVLAGTVQQLDVQTVDGQAVTTAVVAVPSLVENGDLGLQNPGTPVQVSIALKPSGILAGPMDALSDFARSIGLP